MSGDLSDRMRPVLHPLLGVAAGQSESPLAHRPRRILVALSGGVDSTVLLHLTRTLAAELGGSTTGAPVVLAAHLDHAMREGSDGDARAVGSLCDEWGIQCLQERAADPPSSETAARLWRYRVLASMADSEGADLILTGHHADDEVETLLHRLVRGTGVSGLRGIPRTRGRYRRPFLMANPPVDRRSIEAWAELHQLPLREDATNRELHTPRNRIRHRVIPELEQVGSGARDRILRLARNARRATAEGRALADVLLQERDGAVEISAAVWEAGPVALRRALLRRAMQRLGTPASEAVTRAALRLSPDAQSGKGVDLPGGLRFERRFDRWVLAPVAPELESAELTIPDTGPGSAEVKLPGRTVQVRWSPQVGDPGGGERFALNPGTLEFPLRLRGWRAGDRIRRPFGTTAVSKVLAERRVPRGDRPGTIIIEDASGEVVAAEGLGPATGHEPAPDTALVLHLSATEI